MENEKVEGYFDRLIEELEFGNFSDAKYYCSSILNKEPNNKTAIFIKRFIEAHLKGSNGRYKKQITGVDYARFVSDAIGYCDLNKNERLLGICEILLNTFDKISYDMFACLLESVVVNDCANKCPQVFLICKELLKKLEDVTPTNEIEKELRDFICKFTVIKNEYVNDFVDLLKKYYMAILNTYKKMKKDLNILSKKFEKEYEKSKILDSEIPKFRIWSLIFIILGVMVWTIALLRWCALWI